MDKFEAIKKYKELLDDEIITQEEFERKKKDILDSPDDSFKLDSIMNSAKEKTSSIKEKTSKKLDELKNRQAEEAEKRRENDIVEIKKVSQENNSDINDNIVNDELSSEGEILITEVTTQVQKPQKKKFYKRKWFWIVIAVILALGILGGIGEDENSTNDDTAAVVEEQTEESEPVQEETVPSDDNTVEVTDDILLATLNATYEQGTWKIAGDRHFVFYPEGDLATAFTVMGTYYLQYGEIPAELKDSYNSMCDSLKAVSKQMSETAGEPCTVSVANPSNNDNVLMTFMNGETIYNAFEE